MLSKIYEVAYREIAKHLGAKAYIKWLKNKGIEIEIIWLYIIQQRLILM